jgi:WD40 repeat protein
MNTRSILATLLTLSSAVCLCAVQPAYSSTPEESRNNPQSYALAEEPMIWQRLSTQDQTITSVDISPTGDFVASGSEEAIVNIWDLRAQKVVRSLHSHTAKITSVVFSPNGRMVVSGSTDKTIKIWNLAMVRLKMTIYTDHEIHSLAVSPHGQTFASGNEEGKVEIWNLNTGKKHREFNTPIASKVEVSYSEDGNLLVTRYADREIAHFWNPLTGEFLGSNLDQNSFSLDPEHDSSCHRLLQGLGVEYAGNFARQFCGAIASTSKGSLWANIDSNSIVLWRLPNPLKFSANRP